MDRHICTNIKKVALQETTKEEGTKQIGCILDCSRKFSDIADFDFHMDLGDHDGNFFFTCPSCPKKFASTKAMKGHNCISENVPRQTSVTEEVGEMDLMPGESKTKDISPKRFTALNSKIKDVWQNVKTDLDKETCIVKELVKIEAQKINEQSKGESSISLSSSSESGLKLFPCKECGRKLSSEANLEVHLRIHQEQNVKPCRSKGCSETFETKTLLTEHKLAAHDVDKDKVKKKFKSLQTYT